MKKQVSPRDLEALSSFSDSQLKPNEMEKLESRLQTDSQLKEALSEIERIRGVLRNIPSLPAPRSFVIAPELITKPKYTRLFSTYRLMSAIATLLFIIVATGDFLTITRFVESNREEQPNQQLVMEPELDTAPLEEIEKTPESYSLEIEKVQEERGILATETSIVVTSSQEMAPPTESLENEEPIQIQAEAPMEMVENPELMEKLSLPEEQGSLGNAQTELSSSGQIEEEPQPVEPENEKESEDIVIQDEDERADFGVEATLESPLVVEPYPEKSAQEEGVIKNLLSWSKHMWLFLIEVGLALIAILTGIFAFYYQHKS
jgi:hypothetical protein